MWSYGLEAAPGWLFRIERFESRPEKASGGSVPGRTQGGMERNARKATARPRIWPHSPDGDQSRSGWRPGRSPLHGVSVTRRPNLTFLYSNVCDSATTKQPSWGRGEDVCGPIRRERGMSFDVINETRHGGQDFSRDPSAAVRAEAPMMVKAFSSVARSAPASGALDEKTKATLAAVFLSRIAATIASSSASMRRSNAARRAREYSKRSA